MNSRVSTLIGHGEAWQYLHLCFNNSTSCRTTHARAVTLMKSACSVSWPVLVETDCLWPASSHSALREDEEEVNIMRWDSLVLCRLERRRSKTNQQESC